MKTKLSTPKYQLLVNKIKFKKKSGTTMSTQTEPYDMDGEADDLILQISEKIEEDDKFIPTNIEDVNESMDDSEDDESDME